MKQPGKFAASTALWAGLAAASHLVYAPPLIAEEPPAACKAFNIDDKGYVALRPATATRDCKMGKRMGVPMPDPNCTPGAFNPSVTPAVLRDPKFTIKCLRNDMLTEEQRAITYTGYGLARPAYNDGKDQTCELDHLVPRELGGTDTLDNIWPLCGPPGVMLSARYFREKDKVEDYLAMMVKAGKMELADAQKGIAADWTQYSAAARKACPGEMCGRK
jgi:hypothetical protein